MGQRKVNVLLLGETGVGKTTFVNMLPYYISGQSLTDAASKDLTVLAPMSFVHVDDNFEEKIVRLGSDSNEVSKPGVSSTQRPRSYILTLPSKNAVLQVIDTPGIGDTRGLEWDRQNTQELLRYISELQHLDAVCILLKPDNSRFSILFDHCLRVILKELVVNIRDNLLFVFTRSRATHYAPGDTYGPLKLAIESVQRETNTAVPFGKKNTFCIDNEAFRYLGGRNKGITFSKDEISRFTESYDRSMEVVQRMIEHIIGLNPVPMQNVATPNESKRVVLRLSKPLISLLANYEKAVIRIQEYETTLQANISNMDLLKQNLFKIEHQPFVKEHITYEHNRGHNLSTNLGISFPIFNFNANVGYNFTDNERTYKTQDVELVENRIIDTKVYNMIVDENSARSAIQTKITNMNNLCDEYKKEVATILKAVSIFYVYCRENNLVSTDDPFVKALQGAREEAKLDDNEVLASEFDRIIKRYEIKKKSTVDVLPEDIKEVTEELYNLKYSGPTFKEIMNSKFTFHTVRLAR